MLEQFDTPGDRRVLHFSLRVWGGGTGIPAHNAAFTALVGVKQGP